MENGGKGSERRKLVRGKPFFDRTNLLPVSSTSIRKPSSTLSEKTLSICPIGDTPAQPILKLTSETSKASTSNTNASTSNPSIRISNSRTPTDKGNGARNENLIVYSTRGTRGKAKNRADEVGVGGSHLAPDLFRFSPVPRTWDNCPTVKKKKNDKENVTALNLEKSKDLRRDKENVPLSLEKSKGFRRIPADYPPEEDVILLENVNTIRKAISRSYSRSDNKPRRNNFRDTFYKSEDTSPVKAHTEHKRKRPWTSVQQKNSMGPVFELPKKYIEEQRSYFKEVDEFELPVEEVSEGDLD